DVFTYLGTVSPFSTAFLAIRPAPNITYGLDVFVHEVIAAMTKSPVFSSSLSPSLYSTVPVLLNSSSLKPWPWLPASAVTDFLYSSFISDKLIKSCGRFGPASDDSTVDKSSSTTSRSEERRVGKECRSRRWM